MATKVHSDSHDLPQHSGPRGDGPRGDGANFRDVPDADLTPPDLKRRNTNPNVTVSTKEKRKAHVPGPRPSKGRIDDESDVDSDEDEMDEDDDEVDENERAERRARHIADSHDDFLESFDKASRDSNFVITSFLRGRNLDGLGEKGTHNRTLLHKIFSHVNEAKFRRRRVLCEWLMDENPDLYKEKDYNGHTILHMAATVGKDPGSRVAYFVNAFPHQTSVLLIGGDLIHQILPFIRNCDGKLFPQLFAVRNSEGEEVAGPELPSPTDNEGNTVLHLASQFDTGSNTSQLQLVEAVLQWRPEALKQKNKAGHSPYLHRIETYFKYFPEARESDETPLRDDAISRLLKDKIMHLSDRDEIIRLLHGDVPKREIHLDLVELEHRASPVSRDGLKALVGGLNFENILQYVQIPRAPFSTADSIKVANAAGGQDGFGRKDFKLIFDLLKGKKVEKIIRLIVVDDEETPHSDEIIEELHHFDIEVLDWQKLDLSSEVVRSAAPNIQQLFLYSSGNYSVLHGWSCSDGLCELQKLRKVHVFIRRRLESEKRTHQDAEKFKRRMELHCPKVKLRLRVQKVTTGTDPSWFPGSDKVATNEWLENMDKFSKFIVNLPDEVRLRPDIRVAVIDDGVDCMRPELKESIVDGVSFYTEEGNFTRTNPYYFSSTEHGTLMAQLVLRVCPTARLYVARLNQGTSAGSLQPTAESAAKAIRWAILKGANIISMSWTIPETSTNSAQLQDLTRAIKQAKDRNILMFGSASDQGLNSTGKPYPTREPGVFCIGAAKRSGHAEEVAENDSDFVFPGGSLGIKLSPTADDKLQTASGSSLATALATGFTALILYTVAISRFGQDGASSVHLQDHDAMMAVLKDMAVNKYINVSGVFKSEFGDYEWEREGRKELDTIVDHFIQLPYTNYKKSLSRAFMPSYHTVGNSR